MHLKEIVARPEYDFLRTNPHLGPNIMFLTLGGSHAYGTNIEGSDIDVRGVAANTMEELFGLSNFDRQSTMRPIRLCTASKNTWALL